MSKELVNPAFNYELVSKDDAKKLAYYESELSRSRKRVANEIIKHGEVLHGVQELLASYSGGVFGAWIESEGLSRRSVYRAISAFVEFGSCANCHNLEVSAMYELAGNEAAKKKALKLADKGVKVTHAAAKLLIDEAESKAERASKNGSTKAPPPQNEPPEKESIEFEQESEDVDVDDTDSATGPIEPPPATIGEKCPNCLGTKWRDGKCVKCGQIEGESVGDVDQENIQTQRSKAVKSGDALVRAIDDLQYLSPISEAEHEALIEQCMAIIRRVKKW